MARPIGIDLFAGAGGLSLGFEQAGFDVVAAVEIDPIHCAVHKYNFPDCAVLCQSITNLTGAQIRRAAAIKNRRVDVVFGGPPCQGFSMIGQRSLEDPRNGLVQDFIRIVEELDASYFLFENVRGLTVGHHRRFLDELLEIFELKGYSVQSPWQVLDAADFGVPQHRERLILLGAKKGLEIPTYPNPTVMPADQIGHGRLPKGPTCEDAIGDIPNVEIFADLVSSDETLITNWTKASSYARELRNPSLHHAYLRRWNPKVLSSSMRTDHTDISRRRFANTRPGGVEPISRFFKLSASGLCNTLRAGTDSARGAFTSPRPIHYAHNRCITVREMARLHGFPDWFRFHVTKWHGARQIGNAVPPPLARIVASRILAAIGVHAERPTGAISLGDPALLSMEMSDAATHFGVPIPIKRRDRKSGARKRKQHEIEESLRRKSEALLSFTDALHI